MQCDDCKYYLISPNDYYGVCKRYPENQNKNKTDFCGEFSQKEVVIKVTPKVIVEIKQEINQEFDKQYDIHTDEVKPKRGRKPKNVD
jgi:hypothetical protein